MSNIRIKKTLAANFFAQAVTLFIALASVPFFLHFWDVEKYGAWLIIYAIPSYVIAADFGIGSVAVNKMVIARARNSIDDVDKIFQTTLAAISAITFLLFFLFSAALLGFLSFSLYPRDSLLACFFLAILSVVSLYNPCIDGALRYHGLFAESTFILNALRLGEWLGGIIALLVEPSFLSVALGMLLARLLLNGVTLALVIKHFKSPKWGINRATKEEFSTILRPALMFAVFPIANAVAIQGMVLAVGAVLGPAAVVVFTCYRTISRVVTQALTLLNRSYWPEFSESYGLGDIKRLTELLYSCRKWNILFGASAAVIAAVSGKYILIFWTHGRVEYFWVFYSVMLASVCVTVFWQAGWVLLMATNNHSRFSVSYFAGSVLMVLSAFPLMAAFGQIGAGMSIVMFEVAMVFLVRRQVKSNFNIG